MGALLPDPGRLTSQASEVVEFGSADTPTPNHLHTLHRGCMEGKYPLHTDPGRDLPNSKRLDDSTAPAANTNPLEGLDSLLLALTDAIENPDRVPG